MLGCSDPFPSQTLLSPQRFPFAEPRDCTMPCGGRTKETSGPANLCPKPGSAASAWGGHTHGEGLRKHLLGTSCLASTE